MHPGYYTPHIGTYASLFIYKVTLKGSIISGRLIANVQMNELRDAFMELGFESLSWEQNKDESSIVATPDVTPGPLSAARKVDSDGNPVLRSITAGVHWSSARYPAWVGLQEPKDAQVSQEMSSTSSSLESVYRNSQKMDYKDLNFKLATPFGVDHIAKTVDRIRSLLGFQFDASLSAFELLMSQLDSRASRSYPRAALSSLHADYISGGQANFRKWFFASEMDIIEHEHRNKQPISEDTEEYESGLPEYISLKESRAIWAYQFSTASDQTKLEDLIIYLCCWTEANQLRFMPECLAFIVNCARNYYSAQCDAAHKDDSQDKNSYDDEELPENYFLDHIITPLYECYRSYNFVQVDEDNWIRSEGDHKCFIGYDDMNQLFWFRKGLENIIVKSVDGSMKKICSLPCGQWYTSLKDVKWQGTFHKTYRESRSWLHIVTNFSRIWILHAAVFWFYTAYNSPSLYTVGYNYMQPAPPCDFVRWTIMSFGGLIGPCVTFIALIGELRFIPRTYPGAKPVLPRLLSVIVMFFALGVPGVCNLALNDWSSSRVNVDTVPATVISGVLFALAIVYTIYFSIQPLDHIFGGTSMGITRKDTAKLERRYLANKCFTAKFPKLRRNDWIVSWIMCLAIFGAKMAESYFFLTLSLRDPIRELDIMSLEDKCMGDKFLIGNFLCRYYPTIILVATVLTDMALFFLDTYLWYVIFNTVISVFIAISSGTSIWTPWRNIYSRLSHRISSKLLVTNADTTVSKSLAFALRIIWNSIVQGLHDGHLINHGQANKLMQVDTATQEPSFFTMNEDGETFQASAAAERRISFFAQSLSTPMQTVMAVHEMPSFTVMIPHYKEKIILSLREVINTSAESKVTTLEYLRKLYPVEWENFVLKEQLYRGDSYAAMSSSATPRVKKEAETIRQECLARVGFSTWDPNDTNPTRLWASERSQTLYRTVRGFHNYADAIKVLFYAENHHKIQEDEDCIESTAEEVALMVSRKFQLIVAMQLYDGFTKEQLQDVESLFNEFPFVTVSFIEHDAETNSFYSCAIDSSCPLLESGKRKPRLRIKLSGNPLLGDGKSDNQNNALIFYRGEYIQLIDANQDNYLEECLKIRNVLTEFEKEPPAAINTIQKTMPMDAESVFNSLRLEEEYEDDTTPVAIVGAREYIFSENIGILGDVAAGKEQTFGTLFARTLAKIGGKLHYGHPDFLNGIFMTTRGGVSKGQRGLHLNEDIYAGMMAMLRGGEIRHSEYFQCGKGRDLGFVSILNFTAKIGAGMGEQMLSREYFYMGTQLPFDRFTSFYYAHPGFHLNNVFIMLSLEMLLIVTLWFASLASVSTVCTYDRKASPTEPHRPGGCKNILPLLDWTRRCIVSIFLVFFVSLCPLFFQELNEKGFVRSVKRILKHFCSLSMLFEIFVCRIYARSFWEDLNIGGAKYVATGRGLATVRISFHKLFSGYHSEISTGIKAVGVLTYASILLWHPSYLWFWATTFSLCMCPFLYNPHQFAFVDFFDDYRGLLKWFFVAVTPSSCGNEEVLTWCKMVKSSRDKLTGVKKRTTATDSTRPSFRNTMISEVFTSLINTVLLIIPYIYVDNQALRHQKEPETSAILRICFVSLLPLIINSGIVFVLFFVSILLRLIGIRTCGNYIAAISRTLCLLVLILDWWILYILECQRFTATLSGVMIAVSSHHLYETLLTVLFLRRQRNATRTNDPWWTGCWFAAKLGWKCPLIMFEEFLVKTTESLRFTYDFLLCHFILLVQAPLVLIPFIDKLHCLFLLWLPPSVCTNAAKCVNARKSRQRKRNAQLFCLVFVVIIGTLSIMLSLPLYLPSNHMDKIVDVVDMVIPWNTIK